MTFSDAFKEGFSLVNARWQLVLIQLGLMFTNLFCALILIGIPLVIIIIMLGFDISSLHDPQDMLSVLSDPFMIFSRYFGAVMIFLISVLIFLAVATTLWLFVFGGTSGVMARAVSEPSEELTGKTFFSEAKQLFFPLTWYSLIVGLIFIGVFFIILLLGGISVAIVMALKEFSYALAIFAGILAGLVLGSLALIIFVVFLAVSLYGVAVLCFKRTGAFEAFKEAASFLWNNPGGLWLYLLLIGAYFMANVAVMIFIFPVQLIPFVGAIISIPLQIASSALNAYMGLIMTAVVFVYYHELEIKTLMPPPSFKPASNVSVSRTPEDTSLPQENGQ